MILVKKTNKILQETIDNNYHYKICSMKYVKFNYKAIGFTII